MRRRAPLVLIAAILASLMPPGHAPAAGRTIRFQAEPGGSLLVHGEYPHRESSCVDPKQPLLHARFRGTVEVTKAEGGSLYVIGELPFEDYLKGIAEVPRSWPMEALKAQVVAARTYAMTRLRRGSSEGRLLGYDLCATTACQVYLGMGIEAGAWGERWVRAVEQTRNEVLLYRGKTADTLYSSTSNGRTLDNEDFFGGSPQPYLRSIVEEDDGESPVAHWRVTFPFEDLRRFLAANGLWDSTPISEVSQRNRRVVIRGGSDRLRLDKEELRDALNEVAACLDRDYPQREPDGYRLPQTVPSRWYTAGQEGSSLVLEGRGWGHGVGMVQWGAYGKAKRGRGYDEILAAYYGGLRPQPAPSPPGTIRVLIADELERVTVVPAGAATVSGRPQVASPWVVTGGKRMRLLTGEAPAPELKIETRAPEARGEAIVLPISLNKDAKVRVEARQPDGEMKAGPWEPREDGRSTVQLTPDLTGAGGSSLELVADDGVDRVSIPIQPAVDTTSVETTDPPPSPARPSPASRADDLPGGGPPWPVFLGIGGLLLVVALWLLGRGRRGLHRRR